MEAVLYIGHGTRVQKGVDEAFKFIGKAKEGIQANIQETCFLELTDPNIITGIKNCIDQGATSIAAVPVLLLTAVHAKHDIPEEIEKARKLYPDVEIRYGRTFGVHEKMVDILMDRINEQNVAIEDDASVLIIGRGSSDIDVKRDLGEIANLLQQRHPFKSVDTCFMYGATPDLEEGLQIVKAKESKQVFVIPYLLFSGILKTEITERIEQISTTKQKFILCDSLGYHPNILDVIRERANELLDVEAITE